MPDMFIMHTPIGKLAVHTDAQSITGIDYAARGSVTANLHSPLQRKIKRQLEAYFRKPQQEFDLPLQVSGTDFQKKVWRIMQQIPAGRTLQYGEVARRLHSSPRAVGNACRANPIPLIIPCHRIVAKHGLGGFSGKRTGVTVERKRWLLQHEGAL